MGILNILQTLGPILANMAEQRAAGKATEAGLTSQQNQGATSRYQALVNAGRLQNIEQPAANMQQASRGAQMSTWKPVSISNPPMTYGQNTAGPIVPSIAGGSTVTPEMRQTGDAAMKAALARQLGGNTLDTGTFPSDADLGLGALPESGTLDALLGGGSAIASLLGALAKPAAGAIPGGAAAGAVGSATAPLASTPISGVATAPGGTPIVPLGGGGQSGLRSANPGSIMDMLREMQNQTGGSGMYRADNPFATGGSSIGSGGVDQNYLETLLGRRRPPQF